MTNETASGSTRRPTPPLTCHIGASAHWYFDSDTEKPTMWGRLLRDTKFLFVSPLISWAAFVLFTGAVVLGVGLIALVIGLPILVFAIDVVARGCAVGYRQILSELTDMPGFAPVYRLPAAKSSRWRRMVTPLRDAQSWLDTAFCVTGPITASFGAAVMVVGWGAWAWLLRGDPVNAAALIGLGDGYLVTTTVHFIAGIFFAVTLPFALRFAAYVHTRLIYAMLCSRVTFRGMLRT